MSPKPNETEDQRQQIQQTLERVLASPAFRNSKQCQKFLRYVVEHSVNDQEERLKERTIGAEVFGRAPDYDTADDPLVRVRATEVRKRLAQFYQESGTTGDIRMDLPAGSYRVQFHWPAPGATPVKPARRRQWSWVAAVAMAAVLGVGWLWWVRREPANAVDQFWAPFLASQKPVLLYCGQPVVYFLSREARGKGPAPVALDPEMPLHGRDIIPVTDQFVGIGNAHTAALLSAMFARHGKAVEIRYANDLSFSDLRGGPTVLIGAFSNVWTMEMTAQLRYVFEQDGGVRWISDRKANKRWSLANLAPDGKTPEDYAVVSRLLDSATGHVLIAAAGITQYGTRAAGEFLTDPSRLDKALGKEHPDWPRKNIQVLLRTTVYKGTPAPPEVLATHVW